MMAANAERIPSNHEGSGFFQDTFVGRRLFLLGRVGIFGVDRDNRADIGCC